MSDDLWISDGYSLQKTLEAIPGLHSKITVVYRPALNLARREHQRASLASAAEYARADIDLILKHVKTINGEPVVTMRDRLPTMKPAILGQLIDLILGYSPADEESDLKN